VTAPAARRPEALTLATAAFAVATIGLAAVMLTVFPATAELTRGFRTPVLAFELALSEQDLAFLAGPGEAAARARARMDAGHRWDTVFPFAYGGFVALLLVQLARRHERLMWLGVPFALATIPTDLWENAILVDITAALGRGDPAAPLLPALYVATWLKWGVLAVALGVLAIGYLRKRARITGALAATSAGAIGLTWMARANGALAELMTVLLFAFFLAAAVRSLAAVWRR